VGEAFVDTGGEEVGIDQLTSTVESEKQRVEVSHC
jgi:hypothetical protein